ncbi:metal ABC transporter substrate-binding protein [Agromyces mangrovi Wang et al. 2018]|uniref:metal ABC transporter substrate-binding protein n=1 Tax=Agromyces mangrovi TaxID=1858653 RepID=UPI0025722266|nr:metal ABC transporter substrate-binding protein [Agromyces mangrovi]BDZ64567.1 ABC transporter substrate-binding protein [Agromyces mangrovi]
MRSVTPISFAALAAGALVLTGCSATGTAGGSDGPNVVATTTQVADFTRELAGEQVALTALVSANQSAHDFDPSAAQLLALTNADALVINGAGLEAWLDDAIDASGFDGVVIDASTGVELLEGGDDHADEHAEEEHSEDEHSEDDHAEEEHSEEEHSEDEHSEDDHAEDEHSEDEHAHEEGNPHIWTDPARAAQMVENIAAGLADVDGIDAGALETAEADYLAELDALDAWIHENVDAVPADERLLVTNHDAFTYFVDAYDITYVGSVIPGFDDNAEPSAAELDELIHAIEDTGVQAVFSEQSIAPDAAETIAREAGVEVYSGEDALYGDSLGVAGSDGETYIGSQVHNVRLIVASWGVEPTEVPSTLQG